MMRRISRPVAVMAALFLAAATSALAQTTPAADVQDFNKIVAPYIDAQTLLVAHVDLNRVDSGAIEKYVLELAAGLKLDAADVKKDVARARAEADAVLTEFRGLGGRHVFVLVAHPDIFPAMDPRALLLPVVEGKDADSLARFVNRMSGDPMRWDRPGEPPSERDVVKVLPGRIVFIGSRSALERLETLKPEPRPDRALTTGEKSPAVEAVGALSADLKRVFSEMIPELPKEAGGGATAPILQGLRSIRLELALPPGPVSATLELRTDPANADVGKAIAGAIAHLRDDFLADKGFNDDINEGPLKDVRQELLALIKEVATPEVTRSAVTIRLTDRQIRTVVKATAPAVDQAREKARRMESMANIRQALMGCIIYANDNKGLLPATLDELVKGGQVKAESLTNPRDPKHRNYEYRRWVPELSKLPDVVSAPLIWEVVEGENDGLSVGFADGHVEWVKSRKEFEETYLKKMESLKAKSEGPQLP